MDALRNCHRMLDQDGILLDLHPIPPSMHAFSNGRISASSTSASSSASCATTEAELRRTVDEGLFALEAETELDVIERFDTLEQLFETTDEWDDIHLSKRLRARLKRATPPIDFHERLVLRRYRRTRARAARP